MAGYRNQQARARAAFVAIGGSASSPGYDVVLLAGQSNMVGRNGPIDPVLDATNPNIVMYGFDAQTVALAADPLDHQDETPDTIGIGLSFAKAYIAAGLLAPGRKLLLVPVANGGTAFGTGFWRAGGGGDAPAIARTNAAMAQGQGTNVLKAILWHQGESDKAFSQEQYEADLDALIYRWRSAMAGATATTPFICGGLLPGGSNTGAGVSAALSATPGRVTRSGYAPSTGLVAGSDGLHFTAASLRTLGARYFTAYQSAAINTVAPQVPRAVPGLSASMVSGGQSVLKWFAPSNGGAPITDYLVEYRVKGATAWTVFNDGIGTALTATITGLTDGTAYDVRVTAVNSVGFGAPSGIVETGTISNLITGGQTFNTGWSLTGLTATANVAGTAERLTEDTAQNAHSAGSPLSDPIYANQVYTVAVDVTYENLPFIQLYLPGSITNQAYANFDIQNGVLGSKGAGASNSTITSKGGGVYRITMTFTAPIDGYAQLVVRGAASATAARAATYVGTGRTFLANNAQFVTGPDASFYV